VAQSILNSVKKMVGLPETDTSFDLDILTHINSVFSTLNQLGVGPVEGFEILDDSATWETYLTDVRLSFVKTYVFLRVRLLFDPPANSFTIESMNNQIRELEWRINVMREGDSWTDPTLIV
jgi:hypothetical protein